MAEKHVKEKQQANQSHENDREIDINADDSMRGSTHLNEPLDEESELEKTKTELAESKDKYIRLFAEFENFKRRTAKERIDLIKTATRDLVVDLLEVLDDADRGQKQLDTTNDVEQVKEGVSLVFNKLRSTLQAKGLKPMESIGKDFDPDLHEAITEVPAPTPELIGKVVDEVVKGYYLNDKIIRHAKVVVGK